MEHHDHAGRLHLYDAQALAIRLSHRRRKEDRATWPRIHGAAHPARARHTGDAARRSTAPGRAMTRARVRDDLEILFQDDHFVAINKPSDLATIPGRGE